MESKRQRKFVTFGADGAYAFLCEFSRYCYVYQTGAGGNKAPMQVLPLTYPLTFTQRPSLSYTSIHSFVCGKPASDSRVSLVMIGLSCWISTMRFWGRACWETAALQS